MFLGPSVPRASLSPMQPHVSQSISSLGKLLQPGNEVRQKVGITMSVVDNVSIVKFDNITKTKLKLTHTK
jgi:hypothetical protein